eukprot:5438134-Prymnesium_polylepis.2
MSGFIRVGGSVTLIVSNYTYSIAISRNRPVGRVSRSTVSLSTPNKDPMDTTPLGRPAAPTGRLSSVVPVPADSSGRVDSSARRFFTTFASDGERLLSLEPGWRERAKEAYPLSIAR